MSVEERRKKRSSSSDSSSRRSARRQEKTADPSRRRSESKFKLISKDVRRDYPGSTVDAFHRRRQINPLDPYVIPPQTPPYSPKDSNYLQMYLPPPKRYYEQSKEGGKEVTQRMSRSSLPFFYEADYDSTQRIAWRNARKDLNDFRCCLTPAASTKSALTSGSVFSLGKYSSRTPSEPERRRSASCSMTPSTRSTRTGSSKRSLSEGRDVKKSVSDILGQMPHMEKICVDSVMLGIKKLIDARG